MEGEKENAPSPNPLSIYSQQQRLSQAEARCWLELKHVSHHLLLPG